mgnify:CR=1 FL=1
MTSDQQKGFTLWMTGLSGAGKTTIAKIVEAELKSRGLKIERLDGDVVRQSLTRDLGFSKEDREKNIERVTFVAKLLSRNGVGVIASFISPYRAVRDRGEVEQGERDGRHRHEMQPLRVGINPCGARAPSDLDLRAQFDQAIATQEQAAKLFKLLDAIEDCDDVQDVWTNEDVPDEILAALDDE